MSQNLHCVTCKSCHFKRNITHNYLYTRVSQDTHLNNLHTAMLRFIHLFKFMILNFKTPLFDTGPNYTLTVLFFVVFF